MTSVELEPGTGKGITIEHVKNVLIEKGICTLEDVNQQIIQSRRDNQEMCTSDVDAATLLVWTKTINDHGLKTRLGNEGVRQNFVSIRNNLFGGPIIDPEHANLKRSKEDLKLDEAASAKFQAVLATNRELAQK